ncbi:MAG: glycosyl transferase [Clostridia bacterium]|nr:glycosyl transferase [Clostridia bacterium]
MKRLNTVKKLLCDKNYRVIKLAKAGVYNYMNDEKYLKKIYRARMGRTLDLENPELFSEKLQWLKLYDHNPLYTQLVDKYRVREYIAEKVGEEYLVPLLGVWEDPDEIDFDALPERFVLKCNHNSGTGMCICRDKSKLNVDAVKKKLKKGLREDFYLRHREWPYKNVPRRIIAEKLLTLTSDPLAKNGLDDYRFYCFHGDPKLIYVYQAGTLDFGNKPSIASCNIFNSNWEQLPFRQKSPSAPIPPSPPSGLGKMLELSKQLSAGCPFMRVDFYEIDGHLYVGELTLYPGGGLATFNPPEWDRKIGKWLTLPERRSRKENDNRND